MLQKGTERLRRATLSGDRSSNVKHCIGDIGKIVKNEILASTSVLSYLGGEMIKVSRLGTYMG